MTHGSILLVDDEAKILDALASALGDEGHEVVATPSAREARRLLGERPFDVLVVDNLMPEMSGRELAERLSTSHPEMNVLFMSGYCDDAIVQYGVLGGRTAFLEKPFTPDPFIRTVREVLGSSTVKAAGGS